MLNHNTPLEDYRERFGLLVKREDQSCSPPGPPFSKTRGVFAHVAARPEPVIGVLDTYHSQGGQAVAYACSLLGKRCINYWPERKAERGTALKPQQQAARALGAQLVALPAGRSAILYHQAKRSLADAYPGESYMMPNALKLPEMVTETAVEVHRTLSVNDVPYDLPVIVSASSGTVAAGVIKGFVDYCGRPDQPFIIHQGYERPPHAMLLYMRKMADLEELRATVVNEGYAYGDVAKPGPDPLWPCNQFYDLKAFRWWMAEGRARYGEALLWNIG